MYYKKLSFSQIDYTEQDRLQLLDYYDSKVGIRGFGAQFNKDAHTPAYILSLYNQFDFFANNFVVHKTGKCSDTLDTPSRHIHIDSRYTALNIPILGCTTGCATAFFSKKNLKRIELPVPNNSYTFLKQGVPEELDRFYLEMDSAYLLDTTIPHAKIQISTEPRMFLSMIITIPFVEALEYFK